jgi:predicted O-methyltransferase YrrM
MSSPHRDTLSKLVRKHGWTAGAELGVDKGILFERLLRDCPNLSLVGVDVFPVEHRRERCEAIAAEFADRARLLIMRTADAADLVPDGALDFVFIDADHSYDSVREDIAFWRGKVRQGGWIGGHDYNHKWPGVVQAVDEAFGAQGQTYQPGSIWGVWL